jgi:hypothetical protein
VRYHVLGREVMYTVGLGMHISAIMPVPTGRRQRWWPLLLFVGSVPQRWIGGPIVGAGGGARFATVSGGDGLVQMGCGPVSWLGPYWVGLV